MFYNKLKLNPDKTEFLLIGNNVQRKKFNAFFPVSLMGEDVVPTSTARNLGFIFDKSLSLKEHISSVCKSCFFHIKDLKRIRKHVDRNVAICLANALVSSRIDYCNSLFYAATEEMLNKLSRVQNCLARTILRRSKFTSSAPLLKELHWLPVRSLIVHKLCVLTHKTLYSGLPVYLSDLLTRNQHEKGLRSRMGMSLSSGPLFRTNYGLNSFVSFAPHLCNQLGPNLQLCSKVLPFKKNLKTFLFHNQICFRRDNYCLVTKNPFNPP